MSEHLTTEVWTALQEGRLSAETRRALGEHLRVDCEICETFLEQHEGALDGLADDALLSIAEPRKRLDELGWRRVVRARRGSGIVKVAVAMGGLAAVLVLSIGLLYAPVPNPFKSEPTDHLKGDPPLIAHRVDVFVQQPGASLEPLARGAKVPLGSSLAFRLHFAREDCLRLSIRDERGTRLLIDHPICEHPGDHVVEQNGAALGLPLEHEGPLEIRFAKDAFHLTVVPAAGGVVP